MKKICFILLCVLAITAQAQVKLGNNPAVINADAVIQLDNNGKGLLITRVALTAANSPAPLAAFTPGMLVYNTATAGTAPHNVIPGFYFSDTTRWYKVTTPGIEQSVDVTGLGSNLPSPNAFGGAVFSPNVPATAGTIYINKADGTAWIYDGTQYVTYRTAPTSPWYLAGGTSDAGAIKTNAIYRSGMVGIGSNATPDTTALLDVNSTTRGFLMPRMLQAQRDAITLPAQGLQVYCTDCAPTGLYINNGTPAVPQWEVINGGGAAAPLPMSVTIGGFAGNYYSNLAFTASNTFTVTITNNGFSSSTINFSTADLKLTGITGGVVSAVGPASATLAPGASQVVTYTLGGTLATAGTLTGAWTKLYLNGSAVMPIPLGAVITSTCATQANVQIVNHTPPSDTAFYERPMSNNVFFYYIYGANNGGSYPAMTFPSFGVTGLTATIAAGILGNPIKVMVTGTPSDIGNAQFSISLGLRNCVYSLPIWSTTSNTGAIISSYNCGTSTNTINTMSVGVATSPTTVYVSGLANVTSAVSVWGGTVLHTDTVGGISFKGNLYGQTGAQVPYYLLTEPGKNTPDSSGTYTWTINNVSKPCSFTATIPGLTSACGTLSAYPSPALVHNGFVNGTVYSGTVTLGSPGNGHMYGTYVLGPSMGITLTRVPGRYLPATNVTYTISGTYTGQTGSAPFFSGFPECAQHTTSLGGDPVRGALSRAGCTSCAAYDAAIPPNQVRVTQAEFDSLNNTIAGIANFGMKDADRALPVGTNGNMARMYPNNIPTGAILFAYSTKFTNNTNGCISMLGQTNTVGSAAEVLLPAHQALFVTAPGGTGFTTYYYVLKKSLTEKPANTNIAVHGNSNGSGGTTGGTGCDGCTANPTGTTQFHSNPINCYGEGGTINALGTGTVPAGTYLNYSIKWTLIKQWGGG